MNYDNYYYTAVVIGTLPRLIGSCLSEFDSLYVLSLQFVTCKNILASYCIVIVFSC